MSPKIAIKANNAFPNNVSKGETATTLRNPVGSQHKCAHCGTTKDQSEFYLKKDKKTGRNRWDNTCVVCRRQQRSARYKSPNAEPQIQEKKVIPKRTIEPKACEKALETLNGETAAIANRSDFSDIEEQIGKNLSHSERYDMILRLNQFVGILREEYEKIIGGKVYVIKDK